MITDEKQTILRVVENYARTGNSDDSQVKVTRLADNKTSFVDQSSGDGRSIMLDEYHVDNKIVWAAYSDRTGTVYLSSSGY
jgi:hypothetical protein